MGALFLLIKGVTDCLFVQCCTLNVFIMGIVADVCYGDGNSVETMACLVSGDVGLLNAAGYGLFAIG